MTHKRKDPALRRVAIALAVAAAVIVVGALLFLLRAPAEEEAPSGPTAAENEYDPCFNQTFRPTEIGRASCRERV